MPRTKLISVACLGPTPSPPARAGRADLFTADVALPSRAALVAIHTRADKALATTQRLLRESWRAVGAARLALQPVATVHFTTLQPKRVTR